MRSPETTATFVNVRPFGSKTNNLSILAAVNDCYYGDRFGGHAWIETIDDTINFAALDTHGSVSGLAIVDLCGQAIGTQEAEHKLILKCSESLDGTPEGDEVQQNLFNEAEKAASKRGITSLSVKVDVDHAGFFLDNGFESSGFEPGEFFGAKFLILSRILGTTYGGSE